MLTPAERRAIQRRLDRWELEHLREHAAQLAETLELLEQRIDQLERELHNSDQLCRSWHEEAMQLHEALADAEGGVRGLTRDGRLVVVASEARA